MATVDGIEFTVSISSPASPTPNARGWTRRRSGLARSETRAAPRDIGGEQVIEHGLRHLAWLAVDDRSFARELDEGWATLLAANAPERFRNLG
jgi:hypothetical protein